MFSNLKALLPHGGILICNMYIVFFLIDRVNTAMCFIDNGITKGLLVVMCAISMTVSVSLIRARRRADAAEAHRARKARRTKVKKAPKPAQYGTHTHKKAA